MYSTAYSRDGRLGSWGLSRFFFFFFCILRFARAVWWIIEPEYFARGERSWAPPALGQLLPFSWIMQLITLLGVCMDAKSRTFSGTPWPALAGPPVQPLRCHIFQSRPCNRPVSIFFSSCHSSQNPLLPLDMTFHPPQCVLRRFSWPCLDSGMVFPALALHPTWNYTKRRVQKKNIFWKEQAIKIHL